MYNRASARYRKKKQNKKLLLIAAALLLVIAILLIIMLGRGDTDIDSSMTLMPFKPADQYAAFSNGVVYLLGDTLAAIDKDSEELFNTRIHIESPQLVVQGDVIVLYNSQTITAVNLKGTVLFSVPLANIQYVRCCATNVAAMCEDENGVQAIYVFDIQGNAVTSVSPSGKMLDFGFTQDNHMWNLVLDTSGVGFSCRITTYKDQAKTVNGTTVIDSQIIQKALFSETQICVVGTTNIISSNYVGEQKESELIYGWEVLDGLITENDKAVFLLSPRSERVGSPVYTAAKAVVLGSSPSMTQLPSDCFKLLLGDNRFYAFTSEAMYVYDMDCKLTGTHKLSLPPSSIQKAYGSNVFITIGPEVYLLPLP
jgi:hypothetical protein